MSQHFEFEVVLVVFGSTFKEVEGFAYICFSCNNRFE